MTISTTDLNDVGTYQLKVTRVTNTANSLPKSVEITVVISAPTSTGDCTGYVFDSKSIGPLTHVVDYAGSSTTYEFERFTT